MSQIPNDRIIKLRAGTNSTDVDAIRLVAGARVPVGEVHGERVRRAGLVRRGRPVVARLRRAKNRVDARAS